MLLERQNAHPLDSALTFDESAHVYTYTPANSPVRVSVSGVLKRHFPSDFNGAAVVKKNFGTWLVNVDHKYHSLASYLVLVKKLTLEQAGREIEALWSTVGERARNDGTRMHSQLELYLNCELPPPPTPGFPPPHEIRAYQALMEDFYPEMQLRPFRTEFKMVLTTTFSQLPLGDEITLPVVAGSADLLMIDKLNRIWILDWKRTDPRKKGLLGRATPSKFVKHVEEGIFTGCENDDFAKYSAQLLAYKYILEHGGYDMQVAAAFVVQIHPTLERAHVVEAGEGLGEDFEDRVCAMMEAEVRLAREEVTSRNGM